MRLAVKLSLSAKHSRAFNNRTCGNVVRIPGRAHPSRYPPGQLAILELDQSSSAQVINTAIGVLLLVGLIHFPRAPAMSGGVSCFAGAWDLAPQSSDSSMS